MGSAKRLSYMQYRSISIFCLSIYHLFISFGPSFYRTIIEILRYIFNPEVKIDKRILSICTLKKLINLLRNSVCSIVYMYFQYQSYTFSQNALCTFILCRSRSALSIQGLYSPLYVTSSTKRYHIAEQTVSS